jgi:hypothetical protein
MLRIRDEGPTSFPQLSFTSDLGFGEITYDFTFVFNVMFCRRAEPRSKTKAKAD